MNKRALALVVIAALAAIAAMSFAAPPAASAVHGVTLRVTAVACPGLGLAGDGVCLAYNGQIPGPTIDVRLGDTIAITLVNDIPSTIGAVTSDAALIARLSASPVSWHVHGTALANNMDGVAAHPGTRMIESVAHAGSSYTYTVRAAFVGAWHYHDHVLGLDGSEGVPRGLYGGLVVRNGAEPASQILDLHMVDAGANGGRGLAATLPAGSDIDVLAVGLESRFWPIQLRGPTNAILASTTIGPGMSERLQVLDATAGTYRLRSGTTTLGTIVVTP